jgi:hypothetical protein
VTAAVGLARPHTRWRVVTLLSALAASVAVGACRGGGRTTAPGAQLPAPAGAGDSTGRLRDSAGVADRDSLRVSALDSAQRDSAQRAAQGRGDSVAKGDTARTTTVPARPARPAAAASRNCVMDFSESPPETRLVYQRIAEGVSNTFIGGGFVGRCQGENNRLRADSAEQFQAAGIVNLFGNVVYEEPRKLQVAANHAVYFTREGRLFADGNVVATQLESGSTFSGPSIEYFRATAERPVARLISPNRSTARLIEKDSTGRPGAPTTVVANRFEDAGDSLLFAWGDVVITREQLVGRSDSAVFDKITERSRLLRGARIVNNDSARRFTLVGDTIDLYMQQRQLDRVVARHRSRATTDDMQLEAETIDLRLAQQQLEEAFAFGAGRARATTPQQDVDADSLRIRLVDKFVRQVHAIGNAQALGVPDTTKIRSTDRDMLRGDSVFAYFDSSAAASRDSVNGPAVTEIRALGNASSLFHIANSRGPQARPAINYVRGVRIFVNFDTGAVRTVRVDSAASGVFIEPEPDSTGSDTAARDTTAGGRAGGISRTSPPPTPTPTPGATPPPTPLPGPPGTRPPERISPVQRPVRPAAPDLERHE